MACRTCNSFDPNYHGGFCNYFKWDISPHDSCSVETSIDTCSSCRYFNPYRNDYCEYYNTYTYANSSSCSNYCW